MKSRLTKTTRRGGIVIAAISAAIGLSPSANAISLAYETAGPWGPAGTPFISGPIDFIFSGVADGTLYAPFGPAGTVVGTGAGVMDALPKITSPQAIGSEDSFGVLFVQQILDANTNAVIFSPAVKNQQLVGSFYGAADIWGRQDLGGVNGTQTTAQSGFRINLYEQVPQAPNPNLAGVVPADRGTGLHLEGTTPNAQDFPRFTELPAGFPPPSSLTLALSLSGVTGFLDPSAGATFGLDQLVETQSTFVNSVGGQGNVQGFLEVDPTLGSGAMIDNDQFAALFNTNTADARFTFTQQTLPGVNPWLVSVNGPAQTVVVSVPEPGTIMAGLACIGMVLSSRRRKKVEAYPLR